MLGVFFKSCWLSQKEWNQIKLWNFSAALTVLEGARKLSKLSAHLVINIKMVVVWAPQGQSGLLLFGLLSVQCGRLISVQEASESLGDLKFFCKEHCTRRKEQGVYFSRFLIFFLNEKNKSLFVNCLEWGVCVGCWVCE